MGQTESISPGQIIDEPIRPVNIPRKEKDFQGMLEYKKEDEQKLVKNLILGKYFPFLYSFLNNRHLFLPVLETRKPKSQVAISLAPGETSCWLANSPLLTVSIAKQERKWRGRERALLSARDRRAFWYTCQWWERLVTNI